MAVILGRVAPEQSLKVTASQPFKQQLSYHRRVRDGSLLMGEEIAGALPATGLTRGV